MGTSAPQTRPTGAARSSKQVSAIRALISAPRCHRCAIPRRRPAHDRVRGTQSMMAGVSSGRRLRRSMTSASMPRRRAVAAASRAFATRASVGHDREVVAASTDAPRCRGRPVHRSAGELALVVVQGRVLEHDHRIGIVERRGEHPPGVVDGCRAPRRAARARGRTSPRGCASAAPRAGGRLRWPSGRQTGR